MAYTTVGLAKSYLSISGATDDALLSALIDQAQSIIDAYCNRSFEATADTTRYFDSLRDVDAVDYAKLYLDEDLASITSITNGDGNVLTTTEYTTEPRNRTPYYAIRLLPSSSLSWEPDATTDDTENAITIVGRWAFSTTADSDIVHACGRLASFLYRQRDNAGDLDRAVIAGNATILPAQIPSDIRLILEPYRRRI